MTGVSARPDLIADDTPHHSAADRTEGIATGENRAGYTANGGTDCRVLVAGRHVVASAEADEQCDAQRSESGFLYRFHDVSSFGYPLL